MAVVETPIVIYSTDERNTCMKKLLRLGAVLGLGLGVAGATLVPTPAQAATSVTVEFTGTAELSVGLTVGELRSGTFNFNSSVCLAAEAGKKVTAASNCSVEASGNFSLSTCGSLQGSGSATVHVSTSGQTYDASFTVTTTGGEIHAELFVTKRTGPQSGVGVAEGTARPRTATDCTTSTGEQTYDLVNVVVEAAVA